MAALPFIAAAAAAVSTIAETAQERKIGKTQAKGLEEQARAASLETTAAVEAQSRETRRQFGTTRAAGAQMGLLESASFADLYSESATAAELDRLNREYEGEGRRRELMFEAGVTRAARPLWGPAILRAGTNALMAYSGAGGKMPAGGGGAKTIKGTSAGAPSPVRAGSPRINMNISR